MPDTSEPTEAPVFWARVYATESTREITSGYLTKRDRQEITVLQETLHGLSELGEGVYQHPLRPYQADETSIMVEVSAEDITYTVTGQEGAVSIIPVRVDNSDTAVFSQPLLWYVESEHGEITREMVEDILHPEDERAFEIALEQVFDE